MESENSIELKNVSLSYQYEKEDKQEKTTFLKRNNKVKEENRVLDNVTLKVKKGEILGVIGTNGAGKSTLLRVMARILEPDAGTITINGKVATILELGMGFHQDLSGRENIILKGELYGFSKKEMEAKTEEIINYSGIRDYIDSPVRTYSSGMRSRLAFSIMIHVDADVMLVDEILSTGDAAFSAKASDFFKKILKDGKTVVFVSHSPGAIEKICTRAIWLDNGKIVLDGKPKKVCAQYNEATIGSLEVITDQALSGLADAQYRLALFYKNGTKVEKNEDLYKHWIKLSAEQGHIKAQIELADVLINEDNVKDRDVAITYYQLAAARGDNNARLKLATLLGDNNECKEKNWLRIIFKYMAERGNPQDIFRYANFLLKTSLSAEDIQESFVWFKKAAITYNHPEALLQLAIMYRDGVGTDKDTNLYLDTLKRCEELKIIKGMMLLADIYNSGVLVEENQSKALELYEQCAELGSTPSQYIVAQMYQEGNGTSPNIEKANYWFGVYSKSQLWNFELYALDILGNNIVPGLVDIREIYKELEQSKDPKILIELYEWIKNNPEEYSDKKIIVDEIFEKLSNTYGKGLALSYQYYSKLDSMGYSEDKTKSILNKMIYLGNPDQLYKYAIMKLKESSPYSEIHPIIVTAAKMGHVEAIKYCNRNNLII